MRERSKGKTLSPGMRVTTPTASSPFAAGVGAVYRPAELRVRIWKPAAASIGSNSQRNVLCPVRMCSA
jgi:hypothetical protein